MANLNYMDRNEWLSQSIRARQRRARLKKRSRTEAIIYMPILLD
jgi:hypothetical protein